MSRNPLPCLRTPNAFFKNACAAVESAMWWISHASTFCTTFSVTPPMPSCAPLKNAKQWRSCARRRRQGCTSRGPPNGGSSSPLVLLLRTSSSEHDDSHNVWPTARSPPAFLTTRRAGLGAALPSPLRRYSTTCFIARWWKSTTSCCFSVDTKTHASVSCRPFAVGAAMHSTGPPPC